MSALAGVCCLHSGEHVEANALSDMARTLGWMGPDGEHSTCFGPVVMLYRAFFTDAESRVLRQPISAPDGWMLAWDGRIDNRAEIDCELRTADVDPAQTEAELVLTAYQTWGVSTFARLIGDFAVAIWDPYSRRLLLGRDALGRRPLYYHIGPHQLTWSSQARALANFVGSTDLDETFVADYFANRPFAAGPFKGVYPIPPGHVLTLQDGRIQLVRYWSLDPSRRISYSSDEEYEYHFRELFRSAVACRIPRGGAVFCELSGGIDSSSITCAVDALLRNNPSHARMFTVSYAFNRASSSDERTYVRLVEQQLGRAGLHILEDDHPMLSPAHVSFQPDLPTGQLCFMARFEARAEAMRRHDARVLLSGLGGDQLFWSEPPPGLPLADSLARGDIVALVSGCREWARVLRRPFLGMLWAGALRPLLPSRWFARFQRVNRLGEWFNYDFVRRTQLKERIVGMERDGGWEPPSRSLQYALIQQTMRTYALEPCVSSGYVDVRYPYLDRRLVEFALAIPLDQKVRPSESRSLVRRALRGLVPDSVRERRAKAGPDEALYRALAKPSAFVSEITNNPLVCAYGFVDPSALRLALQRARHGISTNTVQLIKTLSLEMWLRGLDRQRPIIVARKGG